MSEKDSLRKRLSPYLKKLGNPYAWLNYADSYEGEIDRSNDFGSSSTLRGITKSEFQSACKRIFRQYIPAAGPVRFDPHHLDFIARNKNRSAIGRAAVLNGLRRYDLSAIPGFTGRFNRNLLTLGREKLVAIELEANTVAPIDE